MDGGSRCLFCSLPSWHGPNPRVSQPACLVSMTWERCLRDVAESLGIVNRSETEQILSLLEMRAAGSSPKGWICRALNRLGISTPTIIDSSHVQSLGCRQTNIIHVRSDRVVVPVFQFNATGVWVETWFVSTLGHALTRLAWFWTVYTVNMALNDGLDAFGTYDIILGSWCRILCLYLLINICLRFFLSNWQWIRLKASHIPASRTKFLPTTDHY